MDPAQKPLQLTPETYRALRQATETYREELIIRLSAEVGLRATEIAQLEPGHVSTWDDSDRAGYFVTVSEPRSSSSTGPEASGKRDTPPTSSSPPKHAPAQPDQPDSTSASNSTTETDPTTTERTGRRSQQLQTTPASETATTRTAYMPPAVGHDFWQYVRSNDIDDEEQVIGVSARRIQMIVSEVGARAAGDTGRSALEHMTPSTLRQYFARTLLVRNGVDVRVVKAVGGWQNLDFLLEGMDQPTRGEIVTSFDQQRDQDVDPGRLTDLVVTLESVDEKLIQASSRDEIDRRVCEQLIDAYRAVWILEPAPATGGVSLRAHAGESRDRFEGAADTGLVRHALETGQTMIAPDEPGPAATTEGRGLLGAVPIEHGESNYGVLVVRADRWDAFEKLERTALSALGRRIAFAITATERRLLLLGGTVLELTFEYSDATAPLVALARRLDCSIELDGMVPGDGESLLLYVDVHDTSADAVLGCLSDLEWIADARLIHGYSDGCRAEIRLVGGSPIHHLLSGGTTVTTLEIDAGVATLVCEAPPDTDLRSLHRSLKSAFPSIGLRSKRERTTARDSTAGGDSVAEDLSAQQRSVLEAAFHAGYFQWPRETTAEELAESMGISSPTLHNHMRKAEQKVLESVFVE